MKFRLVFLLCLWILLLFVLFRGKFDELVVLQVAEDVDVQIPFSSRYTFVSLFSQLFSRSFFRVLRLAHTLSLLSLFAVILRGCGQARMSFLLKLEGRKRFSGRSDCVP